MTDNRVSDLADDLRESLARFDQLYCLMDRMSCENLSWLSRTDAALFLKLMARVDKARKQLRNAQR